MSGSTFLLYKGYFTDKEKVILESGGISASVFRYSSGVEAVRVKNTRGEFVWLPYKGQQIWRASFYGRDLTMKSMFDEPAATDDFISTYGCFMLHCGMTAMGNPAPDDTHPQHGELPNIAYDSACITLGEDKDGLFIEVGGTLGYKRAFFAHYTAVPKIRLHENGSLFDISMTVKNLRAEAMEYQYLCHVNFRPVEGARLVYDAKCKTVHKSVPKDFPAEKAEALLKYMQALEENPTLQDTVDSRSQVYDPEIVFTFDYNTDKAGWVQCRQIAPDGGADYIACRKAELPAGIRWIGRTGCEEAMGMLLPATSEHLGYNYCKKTGQLKSLGGGESITFLIKAGYLPG